MFDEIFQRKKLKPETLASYGFIRKDDGWTYNKDIMGGAFQLIVRIDREGGVDTDLIDRVTGDEYVLYKTHATGAYVGDIRMEISAVLSDIAAACYESSVFKTVQAQRLMAHAKSTWGDALEFLFRQYPNYAVWRRKDNRKWYAAIMRVPGRSIGLETDKAVEIIDLRMKREEKEDMLSKKGCYPGWHMNKNTWFTVLLDGGFPDGELIRRFEVSYALAAKK